MVDDDLTRGERLVAEIFGEARFTRTRRDAPENFRRALLRTADEVIFGRTYTRPGLTPRERALCTVSALTVLAQLPQLRAHLGGALHLGIPAEHLAEALRQMAFYGGFPAALNAMEALDDLTRPAEVAPT